MGTLQRKKIRRPGFPAGRICLDCKVFGWRFLAPKRLEARAKRGPLGLIGAGLTHRLKFLPHPSRSRLRFRANHFLKNSTTKSMAKKITMMTSSQSIRRS